MSEHLLPPLPPALVGRGVTLRLRRAEDEEVLRAVYISYRLGEMAAQGLPAELMLPLLPDQERFQRLQYDSRFPEAAWGVVEVEGVPAGRLYLNLEGSDTGSVLHIIDISFLPEFQNRGLGAGLLEAVQVHARGLGASAVSCHVEQSNPARRLYERLGFKPVELRSGIYWLMVRPVE